MKSWFKNLFIQRFLKFQKILIFKNIPFLTLRFNIGTPFLNSEDEESDSGKIDILDSTKKMLHTGCGFLEILEKLS